MEEIQITLEDARSSFFMAPEAEPVSPGMLGVLYLLRRDINQCMSGATRAVFPAVMLVLAGIDLLAKFYAGSDDAGKVGRRFKGFVNRYMQPIHSDEAENLYQLRNALMHSFGLYSRIVDKKGNIKKEYRFRLQSGRSQTGKMVAPLGNSEHLASAKTLHQRFEEAVAKYQIELSTSQELQKNFIVMFPWYGTTGVAMTERPTTLREVEEHLLSQQRRRAAK